MPGTSEALGSITKGWIKKTTPSLSRFRGVALHDAEGG